LIINNYDKKMLRIYLNKLAEKVRLLKWNIWQALNRRFLITYQPIEDCARCRDCGRNVHDFHVPDQLWLDMIGSDAGVWCYDCFANRADEKLGFGWRWELVEKWY
jgi:hypothetical protein